MLGAEQVACAPHMPLQARMPARRTSCKLHHLNVRQGCQSDFGTAVRPLLTGYYLWTDDEMYCSASG